MAEMLDALTSAYSRKDHDNLQQAAPVETLIGKLFSVLAWGLNSVQEQAELIKLWDNIDNAHGSVLDRYGANFGVKRFGADDAFYRLAIKVKLLAQLSGGDIDTVLDAAASLFEIPVENVGLDEVFPDKIMLIVNEADLADETLDIMVDIITMVKRILAAGICLIMCLRVYPEMARALAGGAFTGSRMKDWATVPAPILKKPGGEAVNGAVSALVGMRTTDRAEIEIPELQTAGGSSVVHTGGEFLWMRREISASIDTPALMRPQGLAERTSASGFVGSVERVTVNVRTGTIRAPTGSAATDGAAGLFHSYQRMWVSIETPNTTFRR